MQEEFGDKLQVILVESQGTGYEKSIAFALKAGWLGGNTIWTSQRPFETGMNGIPNFALFDASGKIVLKGYSTQMHNEIVDNIEQMVRKQDFGSMPKSVQKVYKELNKGKIASAYAMAEKVIAKPGSKNTTLIVSAAEASLAVVRGRFDSSVTKVKWLMQNGYPIKALDVSKDLAKSVAKNDAMAEEASALVDRLESDEFKEQMKLDKKVTKLEYSMYANKKSDDRAISKLSDLKESAGDSEISIRIKELLAFSKYAIKR